MDWRERIETNPDVMGGKPVIKGTRVTAEIILDWLAAGWSEEEILRNYPRVKPEDLRAVFAFARAVVSEQFYSVKPEAV